MSVMVRVRVRVRVNIKENHRSAAVRGWRRVCPTGSASGFSHLIGARSDSETNIASGSKQGVSLYYKSFLSRMR